MPDVQVCPRCVLRFAHVRSSVYAVQPPSRQVLLAGLQHLHSADTPPQQAQGGTPAHQAQGGTPAHQAEGGTPAEVQPNRSPGPGEAQTAQEEQPEEDQSLARSDHDPSGLGEPAVDGGSPRQKRCRLDDFEELLGPPRGPEPVVGAESLDVGPHAQDPAGLAQDAGESAQVPLAAEGHGASGSGGMCDVTAGMPNGGMCDVTAGMPNGVQVMGETLEATCTNETVRRSSACSAGRESRREREGGRERGRVFVCLHACFC